MYSDEQEVKEDIEVIKFTDAELKRLPTKTRVKVLALIKKANELTESVNIFNNQIMEDRLYLMDEVFIPQDFGFIPLKLDDETKLGISRSVSSYILDEWLLIRSDKDDITWQLTGPDVSVLIQIENNFDAHMLFTCIGMNCSVQ